MNESLEIKRDWINTVHQLFTNLSTTSNALRIDSTRSDLLLFDMTSPSWKWSLFLRNYKRQIVQHSSIKQYQSAYYWRQHLRICNIDEDRCVWDDIDNRECYLYTYYWQQLWWLSIFTQHIRTSVRNAYSQLKKFSIFIEESISHNKTDMFALLLWLKVF